MDNPSTADQNSVRKHNTTLIIETLRAEQPLSRAELAAQIGLNRSTVSAIINQLLEEECIQETIYQSYKIGRPGMLLKLNPSYSFAVGIDIGVDYLSAAVLDFTYQVCWKKTMPSDPGQPQSQIIANAMQLGKEALAAGTQYAQRPIGIGIGLPGLVDIQEGILKDAPNLGWRNVPLVSEFQRDFDLPIFLENEANAAALGEYYLGAAQGVKNFIYISGGVGIGGGIMINGELLRGRHGFASEVGHMKFDLNGESCKCGSRGCIETIIGTQAVVRNFQKNMLATHSTDPIAAQTALSFDEIANAARNENPIALDTFANLSRYLGTLAADLVNIFNPQLIILGGYYHHAADLLHHTVTEVVNANSMKESLDGLQVRICQHGTESGVVGAAALVYDHNSKPNTLLKE